jgi:dihydroxy-acid dehydratase
MQLLSEVMGLALPATALIPAHLNALKEASRAAGDRVLGLIREDLKPSRIFTQKALENALVVHAATGGSTNALIHLAAMAREAGLEFSIDGVNRINRQVPFILNLKPSGKFTSDKIWYAGGVPRLLLELKEYLHLDALTVTGLSLGENLEILEKSGHFQRIPLFLSNYAGKVDDIIRPVSHPLRPTGGVRVLTGNLAPDGAVIKISALDANLRSLTCKARVFDSQDAALEAIFAGRIQPGHAVVIRYEGPAGSGMPEQFYVTEAIASNPMLATTTMLITDGRFSGASRGPAIGHVCPEAAHRGPIAAVEEDDLIHFDIESCSLNIIGMKGQEMSPGAIQETLKQRLDALLLPAPRYTRGLLGLYTRFALPAWEGGGLSTA